MCYNDRTENTNGRINRPYTKENDMLSDIEIAESAQLIDIREVAKKLNLTENELELYGKYKAKISLPKDAKRNAKLILVTAINPTA